MAGGGFGSVRSKYELVGGAAVPGYESMRPALGSARLGILRYSAVARACPGSCWGDGVRLYREATARADTHAWITGVSSSGSE